MKYVGLSLSFCVKAILSGQVPIEAVDFIVPGFNFNGIVPESYYEIYWSKWTYREIDAVLSRIELRNSPTKSHNVAYGIWWPASDFDWSVMEDSEKRLTTEQVIYRLEQHES